MPAAVGITPLEILAGIQEWSLAVKGNRELLMPRPALKKRHWPRPRSAHMARLLRGGGLARAHSRHVEDCRMAWAVWYSQALVAVPAPLQMRAASAAGSSYRSGRLLLDFHRYYYYLEPAWMPVVGVPAPARFHVASRARNSYRAAKMRRFPIADPAGQVLKRAPGYEMRLAGLEDWLAQVNWPAPPTMEVTLAGRSVHVMKSPGEPEHKRPCLLPGYCVPCTADYCPG